MKKIAYLTNPCILFCFALSNTEVFKDLNHYPVQIPLAFVRTVTTFLQ